MQDLKDWKRRTPEQRKSFGSLLRQTHPECLFVVVECVRIPQTHNSFFLLIVPVSSSVSTLQRALRKNLPFRSSSSLFFFEKNRMLAGANLLDQLHEVQASPDGFLYLRASTVDSLG